jgi:hypothetical protein
MAGRFLLQPNGRLARFSSIVDNFTHVNMTEEEALREAREGMGRRDAEAAVARGVARGLDAEGGWNACLETIRTVHGPDECAAVVEESLKEKPEPAVLDVHYRLTALVDENFGYRSTMPIEALLTILEEKLPGALFPELQSAANGESGDYTTTCSGCGEEMDEPHTWQECHAVVKDAFDNADCHYWEAMVHANAVTDSPGPPAAIIDQLAAEIRRLGGTLPLKTREKP